jgi:Rrf2 family protein
MISQTAEYALPAEYALRAVVYLADQNDPQTNAQIAEATEVPVGYLAKVMQSLSRARVVTAQRGLRGGFKLAHTPDELTVLEVVNIVDPVRRFHECPLGLHGINLCPLHRSLDNAAKAVEETFGETTIADLIRVPRHRKPLCRFPGVPESAT